MKKNHILTMLFLAYPVALLNAVNKEEKKDGEQIKITFTEVRRGENTDQLWAFLKEIYPKLTLEEKKEYVEERLPWLFAAVKKTLETNGHILKVSESQAGEIGFVSFEVKQDDRSVIFHASPVQDQYRRSAYKEALKYIKANHKEARTAHIGCPSFVQLHDDFKAVGFQKGPGYEPRPDFPKPEGGLIMYSLDLTKLNS